MIYVITIVLALVYSAYAERVNVYGIRNVPAFHTKDVIHRFNLERCLLST